MNMHKLNMRPDPNTFEHPSLTVGHVLREHCPYHQSHEDWVKS